MNTITEIVLTKNTSLLFRETDPNLRIKRSWDVALGPLKQVPMNLFIMYMSGNTISIFPIMMVIMMMVRYLWIYIKHNWYPYITIWKWLRITRSIFLMLTKMHQNLHRLVSRYNIYLNRSKEWLSLIFRPVKTLFTVKQTFKSFETGTGGFGSNTIGKIKSLVREVISLLYSFMTFLA